MISLEDARLAVVGLGYVGLPLAAEFGRKRRVVGFDINAHRIKQLISGVDITQELSVDELAEASELEFTNDLNRLESCNVYIVTVPTPVTEANLPDLSPLISASKSIGQVLKRGDVVIYESTVFPGCTEEVCVPELEYASGLVFNEDFFCGYSPERINPGDKVNRLPTIKKITSGSTEEAAGFVDELYQTIITAGTHKAPSMKVAEAAKVIENTQRDINIGLINELSILFDRIGIDTSDVLDAAATKWNFLRFSPGLVGGHCIGVDPYYLTYKAEQVGYLPQIITAGRRLNDDMARYLAHKTIQMMLQKGIDVARSKIGILGVTFKENCPDIRNSKIFDVIDELNNWGASVVVADQWASAEEVADEYGIQLEVIDDKNQVDALIVAVGHEEYRCLTPAQLKAMVKNDQALIIDVKSLYSAEALRQSGCKVFRL